MQFNRTIRILLTLVLVAAAAWLGTSAKFYTEALIGAFFGLALLSVLVIHFRIRPSWLDALLLLAGTLLLAGVDFRLLHFKPAIMAWPSFAGLVSLLILGVRAIWAEGANRKLLRLGFVPALLFVTSEYFADSLLQLTSRVHPKVFDLYLFSFDSSLRVQIAFLVGQAFSLYPNLRLAGLIFYIGLPIPIALIYAGRVLRMREKAIPAFVALLATGPIGVIFYNLLPALGPVHIFGSRFPWHPLTVEQSTRLLLEPLAISGAPNAIPSLHMAWVLLAWWYSRGLSWWERSVALAFLFFTVIATMGTGEHYFVDLVVAFPFAVLIEALCTFTLPLTDVKRLAALALGLVSTLAWMEGLHYAPHFFWRSPLIPWMLCAATVGIAVFLENRLWSAMTAKATLGTGVLEPRYDLSDPTSRQHILDEKC
ncbi:MAG TPA: phosphatase PAP2 family protein [Candidatus Angelobacter sp.]|nr:phosphatase PAP2 family protein [Candidatus Angelobacter sp.]